eukprot:scaffold95110_cov60-Phaeocystis_antarctica.AAC.2
MYAPTFCLSSSESSADAMLLDDLPVSKNSSRNAAGCTSASASAAFESPTTACPSIALPPDDSMYLSYSAFLELGAAMGAEAGRNRYVDLRCFEPASLAQ